MKLFQEKQGELIQIEKDSFKLEKDIQALCEANMETLFGLEFVRSEFRVAEFRLDSLAYDEQNRSFVIVEYKRGHSYSLIDQGYSYLSAMLNNKADFILEYNEKSGKQLKRNDIDWSATRVIFISPSFNAYQKNSINFRDVPFELWEIKKFDGGLIALEQQVATSNASISNFTTTSGSNSGISEVATEVKVSTEEDHTAILGDELLQVWQAFKVRLLELPSTQMHITNSYLAVKYDGTILVYITCRKKDLRCSMIQGHKYADGTVNKNFFQIDDPKQITNISTWKNQSAEVSTDYYFSIESHDDLDYAMFLVKQKYDHMS